MSGTPRRGRPPAIVSDSWLLGPSLSRVDPPRAVAIERAAWWRPGHGRVALRLGDDRERPHHVVVFVLDDVAVVDVALRRRYACW